MNKHRMLPLLFTVSFVLLLPVLALSPAKARTATPGKAKFATILARADQEAATTRASWHTTRARYMELVSLDQR